MIQNSLTKKSEDKFSVFMGSESVKKYVNSMVGGEQGQRFMASIMSAVSTNASLGACDNWTIISGAMLGEALKLSPSPQLGQFYLVPYGGKAQFQMGYKGYIQLAMRSGQYEDIDVIEVKQGEYKGRDKTTGKPVIEFIENESIRENLPTIGYFTYFILLNGFKKSIYWSIEKMTLHAQTYSKAFNSKKDDKSSFWFKNFNDMAFKTLLRHLLSRWGIMSIEMQDALSKDMAVINQDKVEYVDNTNESQPQTIEAEVVEVDASNQNQILEEKEF